MANKVLIINKKALLNNGKVLAVPKAYADYVYLQNKTSFEYETDEKTIPQKCFYYSKLSKITAKNATSIGGYAFYSCSALTSINLPNATSIGGYAFGYCSALTSIDLPNCSSFGSRSLAYCPKLANINLPKLAILGSQMFEDSCEKVDLKLPYLKIVNNYGFYSIKAQSIYMPMLEQLNGNNIWDGYPSYLKKIIVDDIEQWLKVKITNSGGSPFRIKQSGTYVGLYVGNELVRSLNSNVEKINDYNFYCNKYLTSIDLPNATSIGDSAFDSCSALTSIDLPNATSIGSYVFRDCTSLTSVSLPNAIYIGSNGGILVFYNCTSLTSIDLPNAIYIGGSAFYSCSALTSATMPKVKTINSSAFASCTSLKLLDFRNIEAVPTLSSTNAIPTNAGLQIVVPDALYDSWCTATNWTSFTSYIVKESEYAGV